MEYKRNCPGCNKELFYSRRSNFKAAEKQNNLCLSCASKTHTGKRIYDYENHFDNISGKYFYLCRGCNDKIFVANRRGLRRALKKNNMCLQCTMNTKETKDAISAIKIKQFADPNSIYNTKEYIDKRNKAGSIAIMALNLSTDNPSYKNENKTKSSIRIAQMRNDETSTFYKATHSDEYYAKLSEAKIKQWADPKSKFNTPEFKKKACDRLLKSLANQGKNVSKSEVIAFDSIKHLGFVHNSDLSISIANYRPDFIHNEYKIIVEFNGDMYHANPSLERYKKDDALIILPGNRTKTAGEIREYDKIRKTKIEAEGYIVFIIWEYDFRSKNRMSKVMNDLTNLMHYISLQHLPPA